MEGDKFEESVEGRPFRVYRPWGSWVLFLFFVFCFSVLEFIAALSERTMRSDLCFQIAEAAGSTEAAEEEGSQKFRRTRVEAKQGMRSKWSFTRGGIEGTECSS